MRRSRQGIWGHSRTNKANRSQSAGEDPATRKNPKIKELLKLHLHDFLFGFEAGDDVYPRLSDLKMLGNSPDNRPIGAVVNGCFPDGYRKTVVFGFCYEFIFRARFHLYENFHRDKYLFLPYFVNQINADGNFLRPRLDNRGGQRRRRSPLCFQFKKLLSHRYGAKSFVNIQEPSDFKSAGFCY